ncbi:restriction endonuclease subunit S [Vibrio vulnificus]|uniref:restriction endonuclease subunit S n=1 Tax=Vibrio vulnificus TaxID=672 RepID=UPI000D3EB802|nr:restriction endonuclease subunit S [Vibrio vulnificus]MBN8141958.1 restriction endonuclease subunit S [Vibrio vulnificus]MBN8151264.1 restriction endonuclease subunit S [Vibrio vulnificus]NIG90720.1 restriction endonuclease subunit S [Vibrio vulnificus]PUZ82355.1 type I restriction endonuclease subunit S [Vibrio vulnificus]
MSAEKLITDHIDIWTSAVQAKSASGRGSSKKRELYGIKKLRELILELAVRGKLVPQDPNDEPASVLLERIAEEKAQLVKEKKIKKPKKLPEITEDDIPFKLPEGWSWGRVNELSKQVTDGVHHTPKYIDEGVPFISVKDLDGKTVSFDDCKYISHEQHIEINQRCNPEFGDILLCRIGTLGRATVVDTTEPFSLFVSVGLLKFFNEYLTSSYLHKVFHSPLLLKQYDEIKAGGSHTNKLNLGDIPRLWLPIPPINEQHRIVAKVDELMAMCDKLEQQTEASLDAHQVLVETLLTTLTNSQDATELMANWSRISEHFDTLFTTELSIDQLKQTILQLAVMGKLVAQDPNDEPAAKLLERIAEEKAQLVKEKKIKKQKALPPISEDEKPFELPSGWEFAHMQDLCSLITDGTHQTPKYTDDGRPFISAQCVKPFKFMPQHCRYVSEEHYQAYIKNRKPEFEDILLSRVGAGIGEAAVIDSDIEFAIYVSTGLLKPHKSQIHARYLELWLNSPIGRGFSERNTLGKGVSQGNLNLTLIRSFIVSLPPIKEQLRIVAKFRELNEMCDQLIERLRDSQQTQLQLTDAIVEQAL